MYLSRSVLTIVPQLARVAISFSSYESFWLACLGLTCAVLTEHSTVPKSFASLFIGLAIASVGIDIAVGHPRFTYGVPELLDGISFIPAMIGIFAFSEVLRTVQSYRPSLKTGAPIKESVRHASSRMLKVNEVATLKNENWIKNQLKSGKTIHALWAETGSATLAEAAVYAGWPVILIDNEHGMASLETTVQMVRAVESAGGHVIVRVPWNDQVYLKRILDLGVRSIMIPMIDDGESATKAVAACRYPPRGRRGYAAPVVRASGYGTDQDYAKNATDQLLLIAQIEHVDAIEKIADIAGIDGIDLLFIGPNDLAGSMGKLENLDTSDVREAVEKIETRIQAAGKMMGCLPLPNDSIAEAQRRGHRFIAAQADIGLFMSAAAEAAREWQDCLTEKK